MADPGVGARAAADRPPVCSFTGPTPFGPECGQPATVHVAIRHAAGELAGLPTCGAHIEVARSIPRYFSEHPHVGWCSFPGSAWDEDAKCCVLDDSGQSRAPIPGPQAVAHV